MPYMKVKIKWGKELFNLEVNNDEDPLVFKAQLYALTGVQPQRQKVMCKGTVLKDDVWNVELKEGSTIFLMGSKEDVPEVPIERPTFIEDLNEEELAIAMELPAGLTNLGNTCYMNAVVQCLRSVPELQDKLKYMADDSFVNNVSAQSITSALKGLFLQMDSQNTVTPILLLQTLHIAFPQFAQAGENGTYRQQDANECWSELLKMLQQKLRNADSQKSSFIDQYFGGTFNVEMKCNEAPNEPSTKNQENFLQLSCFISSDVKYMHSGLKSKLQENITKRSVSLGRDALYMKSSLINRLPAYLTIQFVRFQYKGKEGINAKVLKDIKFSIDFDAFDLCSPELQQKLTPVRAKFKELEDAKLESQLKDKDKPSIIPNQTSPKLYEDYWFHDDIGSNNSGFYTLHAVLTHKGRSSSSGHYVAWVKQKNGTWMKFDDDVVSPVTSDDILRLSGGGDWHCAYVLLYGPTLLEKKLNISEDTQKS